MNITTAFKSMLSMFTSFFSAAEKIGKTLDNLAEVAYQTSAVYVDEAAADRKSKADARAKAILATDAVIEQASTSSKTTSASSKKETAAA